MNQMATRTSSKTILPLLKAGDAGFEEAFEKLTSRRDPGGEDVDKVVSKILARVREGGDEELLACIKKYDGADLEALEVTPEEMDEAGDLIDGADRAALGKAAMRIREFHRKRIPSSWEVREEGGGIFCHRVRPLHRVGLYVPGGKALYPSTVIMNAVPASVVEVTIYDFLLVENSSFVLFQQWSHRTVLNKQSLFQKLNIEIK